MAGDWIKMRSNLWDDPRITRICDMTDAGEAAIVGGLYWLWATADQHSADGIMHGLTLRAIDRKTGLQGFAEALVSVGWLADYQEGVRLTRFEEHNGASAKKRCEDAKRKSNVRKVSDKTRTDCGQIEDEKRQNAELEKEKRREDSKPTNPDGLVVASDAAEPSAKPDCPHLKIIDLYHEVLPQCPQIRDWTPARAVQLRARWNEDQRRQNLDYWRQFFEYVATCDFLVGKKHEGNRRPFFADLEWIVKSANFTKIREGRYAND